MRSSKVLVFIAVLSPSVSAWPVLQESEDILEKRQASANPWKAPGVTDVRSPCPGTNTLANHGFINRNGRNITFDAYTQGFMNAFGYTLESVTLGANNSLNLCSQITGTTCTAFDLDMLNTPHAIEHDASLSRLDKQMANNQNSDNSNFNPAIWGRTKAVYALGNGGNFITPIMANTARLERLKQARHDDYPGWLIPDAPGSLTEAAFILYAMNDFSTRDGNQTAPKARVDWVDYWFKNQRLPTSLGWKKNKEPFPNYIISIKGLVKSAGTYSVPTKTKSTITTVTSSSSTTTADQGAITTSSTDPQVGPTDPPQPRVRGLEDMVVPRATDMAAASLPSNLAQYPASAVSEAQSSAAAAGGPTPVIPNFYEEEVDPKELDLLIGNVKKFRVKRQNAFVAALKRITGEH